MSSAETTMLDASTQGVPGFAKREALTGLSTAQTTAVQALLEGASVTIAARDAGVTRQTVSRWRREDGAFQAALEAGWDGLRESFTDRGPGLVELALNTLVDVMLEAPDSRSRVRAAELVFRFFGERILTEERAAKLEASLAAFREAGHRTSQSRAPVPNSESVP